MEFTINNNELDRLYGLPHIQQLVYIRGIRPYMDFKTGIVGEKRGISYQSLTEQLYIEPHPGIKATSFSRAQARRAIAGLERVGLIEVQSEDHQLILKCLLATRHQSVQNKAVTNPSQLAVTVDNSKNGTSTGFSANEKTKADTGKTAKAVIPPNKDYLLFFLLSQFEQFWSLYPQQQNREKAWDAFQRLNPDEALCQKILHALEAQINHRKELTANGQWVPAWKYPANWLSQQGWNETLPAINRKESHHETHQGFTRSKTQGQSFWHQFDNVSFDFDTDSHPTTGEATNVVYLRKGTSAL
ncbi:Legionella vir region protein [Legionella rubrilucens]|uniref:Legionella vir region protein n=1 Tax=Legionella rubrilucens TaxID=458 RepID=A0A0W0XYH4_9GAMM|nr:hypothetical protein [Legionella rubrilucens]KTD49610.1 Legionella vir region protein [Legionella rubrilucens]